MSRRTTLQRTLVAVAAGTAVAAAPALAKPTDRIDRYDHVAPQPQEKFQPGQPTWPTHPAPAPKLVVEPAPVVPASGGGSDDVWLIVGVGLATAGIVAGSAVGASRRHRVRARRVAA
jgi:hypothetical protein